MNIDSYFEIGKTHLVCQDYALCGKYQDMAYAIVSDGCSSAEHSEIGAQILCHVAKYNLELYYNLFSQGISELTISNLLANSILKRADEIRKIYPITPAALQATLVIAVKTYHWTYVFAWGDGFIIENNHTMQLEYPDTNAPFYLCTDKTQYIEKFGNDNALTITDLESGHIDYQDFDSPYMNMYRTEPGLIMVGTDGLNQYQDDKFKDIKSPDIISEITDFPTTSGEFLKRTMNFLKKDYARKGWFHSDDIGLAVIL